MTLPCPCAPQPPTCLIRAQQEAEAFLEDHPPAYTMSAGVWMALAAQLGRRTLSELNTILRSTSAHGSHILGLQRRVLERLNERPSGYDALTYACRQGDVATVSDLLRSLDIDAYDVDTLYRRSLNMGNLGVAQALEPHADRAYPHQALLAYLANQEGAADMTLVERHCARLTREDWHQHGTEILCSAALREATWPSRPALDLVQQLLAQNQSVGVVHKDEPLSRLLDSLLDHHATQKSAHTLPVIAWLTEQVLTTTQLDNSKQRYVETMATANSDLLARHAPVEAQDRWLAQHAMDAPTHFPWLVAKRQAEERANQADHQAPTHGASRRRRT